MIMDKENMQPQQNEAEVSTDTVVVDTGSESSVTDGPTVTHTGSESGVTDSPTVAYTGSDSGATDSPTVVYNWKDVSKEFETACSELQLGELMHDSVFGLFEAMSAIEMMDPKMDAGMMCNQAKRKVLSLDQAVQEGVLKMKDLTSEEIIGIIDDTLACLVTWLEGHSLAQTVFTNLYMHNPYIIEDRTLKAFCVCTLKMVDLVRDRINRASVFEEEDFQPMTYGFKMATDVSDVRVYGMAKEVEDDLNRIIKNTRSKPGEERDATTEKEHEQAMGVHARIKFCRLLFASLLAFSKEKYHGMEDVQKLLQQCLELFPSMKRTQQMATKPETTEGSSHDYPTVIGFDPLVNQRLLPPTFPRYTQIKSRQETLDYLEDMIGRLKVITNVTEISSLHGILDFFVEFSKPSPCVLSRSLLQLMFLPNNRRVFGSQNMVDVLRESIRNFIAPPVLMQRSPIVNHPQAKEYVDAFLTHAVRPVTAIFQVCGHNRARQRDKWGHLLEELASLQEGADKVDAFLHTLLMKAEPTRQYMACFGTWVLYHTLQIMVQYVLAGFELELYAVHEYHYIFWYLYECLFSWLISTLSRTEGFLMEQEAIFDQQQKVRTNKKNKKKKKTRPHQKEVTKAQATQSLCSAFYKAVVGLTLAGKLKHPEFEFDSEEVRYNHRFAPFSCLVTPPLMQYGQFKDMTDLSRYNPPIRPEDLYNASCKYFQGARLHFETIQNPGDEILTLIKIAKTNYIVMKLLLGGHKKDSTDAPEFDFSLHPAFPLIKIT